MNALPENRRATIDCNNGNESLVEFILSGMTHFQAKQKLKLKNGSYYPTGATGSPLRDFKMRKDHRVILKRPLLMIKILKP